MKRVSIDETFGAETGTEKTKKAKRTAIVAKEQPAAGSNALSQQSLITVEERTKIAELRQLVNDEKEELLSTDALKMYCSDAQLARNLRARKWDVLKAFEMLKKTSTKNESALQLVPVRRCGRPAAKVRRQMLHFARQKRQRRSRNLKRQGLKS